MRKYLQLFILLLPVNSIQAQIKFSDFIDEYSVSINQALSSNKKTKSTGFGIGIYHTIPHSSYLNILLGFEYNRVNEFFNTNYSSHFESKKNEYFRLNYLSIPVLFRFKGALNPHTELFFNPGGFIDWAQKSRVDYDYHSVTFDNNVPTYHSSHAYSYTGSNQLGFSFGAGIKFKKLKYAYFLHLDLKIPLKRIINDAYAASMRLSIGMSLNR